MNTLTPQQRFILYWHTWLHNCEKDTFFYIRWVAPFFTEIVKFHLAVPPHSFIVGYLWSSAQGVATSCSLWAFQVLSDDKWLPYLALTVNLHVISCVSFPRCKTPFFRDDFFSLRLLDSDIVVGVYVSGYIKHRGMWTFALFCTVLLKLQKL